MAWPDIIVVVLATSALAGGALAYFRYQQRKSTHFVRVALEQVLRETPLQRESVGEIVDPASTHIVSFSENLVLCTYPDGRTEVIDISQLSGVDLVTTDDGPLHPDVFWVLLEGNKEVLVPWGASNEPELMDAILKLDGLDFDAMIEASTSTRNARFVCWRRHR